MEYRKFGDAYYVRMDRGDEVVACILDLCAQEGVQSATFWGIGGCDVAEIMVLSPETGAFAPESAEGILELVSLMGNVIWNDGERSLHAHALFAYRDGDEPRILAGHLKSARVRYTAEIEVHPVMGGTIKAKLDPETGTDFWAFDA